MTEFRGRSTQIHVYPLSFGKYLSFFGKDAKDCLEQYLLYGGMPRILSFKDEAAKKKYLSYLYDEVYIKDIIECNKIKRSDIFKQISDYLSSQISSLTNPTKVANAIGDARKEKIDSNLVLGYINHSVDAFLISIAKRDFNHERLNKSQST